MYLGPNRKQWGTQEAGFRVPPIRCTPEYHFPKEGTDSWHADEMGIYGQSCWRGKKGAGGRGNTLLKWAPSSPRQSINCLKKLVWWQITSKCSLKSTILDMRVHMINFILRILKWRLYLKSRTNWVRKWIFLKIDKGKYHSREKWQNTKSLAFSYSSCKYEWKKTPKALRKV